MNSKNAIQPINQQMKIFAETERLILREICPEDVDAMFELDSDPEVQQYVGNQPIRTKEEALANIQFIRQQYIDNGVGRFAVIEKKNGHFIGWAGLKLITEKTNKHINYHDLGYRLIKKYWGQGFATEAAQASLHYAFNELNASEVYSMADCGNKGSNRILFKSGLKLIEVFDYKGVKHNWYKIKKEEFEKLL